MKTANGRNHHSDSVSDGVCHWLQQLERDDSCYSQGVD